MKKILSSLAILLSISCTNLNGMNCSYYVSYHDKINAQFYYDTFGTSLADPATKEKAKKLFGCQYRVGDSIYTYKTMWSEKYILVRYGTVITYVDEK